MQTESNGNGSWIEPKLNLGHNQPQQTYFPFFEANRLASAVETGHKGRAQHKTETLLFDFLPFISRQEQEQDEKTPGRGD
jgi:hypothetical protein